MGYYLDLFSPETYEAFSKSARDISGFRLRQQHAASKIHPGDKLVCYMTKLSRWIGVLEVKSDCFREDTPLFYEKDDPFVIRFKVHPIAWLTKEKAIPMRDERVWRKISFTRDYDLDYAYWTGKFRNSLNRLEDEDGKFLEQFILAQINGGEIFEVDLQEYEKLLSHEVRRIDRTVTVSVPQETEVVETSSTTEVRESIKMQALLAKIGAQMGMRIGYRVETEMLFYRNGEMTIALCWTFSH